MSYKLEVLILIKIQLYRERDLGISVMTLFKKNDKIVKKIIKPKIKKNVHKRKTQNDQNEAFLNHKAQCVSKKNRIRNSSS